MYIIYTLDNFQVCDQKTQWLIKKKVKAKKNPFDASKLKNNLHIQIFISLLPTVPAKEQVYSSPQGTLYQKEADYAGQCHFVPICLF